MRPFALHPRDVRANQSGRRQGFQQEEYDKAAADYDEAIRLDSKDRGGLCFALDMLTVTLKKQYKKGIPLISTKPSVLILPRC